MNGAKLICRLARAIALIGLNSLPATAQDQHLDSTGSPATQVAVDTSKVVSAAADVYRALKVDSYGPPESVLKLTRCIIVIPTVNLLNSNTLTESKEIVGEGVAACRTAKDSWSKPVFVKIRSSMLGVTDSSGVINLVLFLTGDGAAEQFKQGRLELGKIRIIAGDFAPQFDLQGAELVVYRQNGATFVGTLLRDGEIVGDESGNRQFFEMSVQMDLVLSDQDSRLTKTDLFTAILP